MVSEGWAVEVVQRYLAEWAAEPYGPTMVVTEVRPHRLGWVVGSHTERYLRTQDITDMLIGHGYFLVDGEDGSLYSVAPTADLEHGRWIDQYLEQVRGIEPVDPLRSQVADLLDRGQRLDALKLVRATAPDLGPQGAKDYVDAVAAGVSVPNRVRLTLPRIGFTLYTALSGPNPERSE